MKAKQIKVSLGPKIGGDIIIRQGLNEGDQDRYRWSSAFT